MNTVTVTLMPFSSFMCHVVVAVATSHKQQWGNSCKLILFMRHGSHCRRH